MTFNQTAVKPGESQPSQLESLSSPPQITKTSSRQELNIQDCGESESQNSTSQHIQSSAKKLTKIQQKYPDIIPGGATPAKREKSIEQMVDTVNRKYEQLFGNRLVALKG